MARLKFCLQASALQKELLEVLSKKRTLSQHVLVRAKIVYMTCLEKGSRSIAQSLSLDRNTVKLWRRRWMENCEELDAIEALSEPMRKKKKLLLDKIVDVLSDLPRSGKPSLISDTQRELLVAMACESPTEFGVPQSHWTHQTLARTAVQEGIFSQLSPSYAGVILKKRTSTSPQ